MWQNILKWIVVPIVTLIGVIGAVFFIQGIILCLFHFEFKNGLMMIVPSFIVYKISEWIIEQIT